MIKDVAAMLSADFKIEPLGAHFCADMPQYAASLFRLSPLRMRIINAFSERQAHLLRWILLVGWLGLILTMLVPGWDPWPFDADHCPGLLDCHHHEGNQMFWGVVVPLGVLVLVLLSHDLWRRMCPLAFVSQLFRALGLQRTVLGKGGRHDVAKVEANSWLARHHIQLQWALFIAGLSLRLLVVNSNPLALGLFLSLTVLAALVVGWAYSGKAWCQYFCPMAPVQTLVTGPLSLLGGPSQLQTGSALTQSMCRSVGATGKEVSACVACQSPCIDIDSERTYWHNLFGKPGLNWAWYSYPGFVLGFFLLIEDESRGGIDYLRSGMWAYDNKAMSLLGAPLSGGLAFGLPRLFSLPALLVLAGCISVALFSMVERFLLRRFSMGMNEERSRELARHRTRLLASFLAVNSFFWFADPSLGAFSGLTGQLIRSLVLGVSGMWFYRGWYRERSIYKRESTTNSLRKQLAKLLPDLEEHLEGRSLSELSADEVYALAKVMPAQVGKKQRQIYASVLEELFTSGRLERADSLVQLEELRKSLGLVSEDHYAAIRQFAISDPRILALDQLKLDGLSLRKQAAVQALEDLLDGSPNPHFLLGDPRQQERLERIRRKFGLDDLGWNEVLAEFGPGSAFAINSTDREMNMLGQQLAARQSLAGAAEQEPLLNPLLPVMDRRIASCCTVIQQGFMAHPENQSMRFKLEQLFRYLPPTVLVELRQQVPFVAPAPTPVAPSALGELPDPADVIDSLWIDPDPDTARWVLWVQRKRSPQRAEALLRQVRPDGFGSSQDTFILDYTTAHLQLLSRLVRVPLVAGLSPGALFSMVRWGELRQLEPGASLFKVGDPADLVAILLEGQCIVLRGYSRDGGITTVARIQAGESIGDVAFFADHRRKSEVRVADGVPAQLLVFSAERFESLLQTSPEFSRSLLRQMALRIEDLYGKLALPPSFETV
jgi:Cyclic nucleotide-binding domain